MICVPEEITNKQNSCVLVTSNSSGAYSSRAGGLSFCSVLSISDLSPGYIFFQLGSINFKFSGNQMLLKAPASAILS